MNITKSCCKACHTKWPYALVFFIATFVSLLTWLTLATENLPTATKVTGSVTAFAVVFVLLFAYIAACLRRHCGHQGGHAEGMS
uniref:Uncharacterized protein n=1 Tax=Candidatus Kentrum sp. DK TaxID=2126562 RepID=A0A450SNG4_9GAMM|nr:MAG: hypothetical protein BECKDK2373C_GA0170839_104827 [Candidatus Kentron sp. DK]VFJ67479.1 MAG: hypothetical protein BECKDK2373B_GA0170837_11932 [Candidatus Kentron sp. DK]